MGGHGGEFVFAVAVLPTEESVADARGGGGGGDWGAIFYDFRRDVAVCAVKIIGDGVFINIPFSVEI